MKKLFLSLSLYFIFANISYSQQCDIGFNLMTATYTYAGVTSTASICYQYCTYSNLDCYQGRITLPSDITSDNFPLQQTSIYQYASCSDRGLYRLDGQDFFCMVSSYTGTYQGLSFTRTYLSSDWVVREILKSISSGDYLVNDKTYFILGIIVGFAFIMGVKSRV